MSQPTLWGHASRVPGRGWRGWLRPLRSPGRPRSGRPWRARGRQVARIGGNLNHLGAVSGLVERRRRPHWDDLPSHLAGEKPRPAAGFVDTPRSQRRLMAFPHGIAGPERPPDGGWMGVHIQPSPMPYQASKEGGRSRHGRTLRNGIAAPAALVQPQCSQRHAEPLARTWKRRFRAHAPRCRCARAARHRPPATGGEKSTSRKSARTPSRIAIDHRSGARTGAGPPAG